ncbi:hypothetical protein B0J14DRAFT_214731 [Halenospora varia]|nr:hypothetical protein B0J14DRAFT_214731 [Halenospora varia]
MDPARAAESRIPQLFAVLILATVLASTFLFARIYCRAIMLRRWAVDDSLLLLAWVCMVVAIVLNCLAPKYDIGFHIGSRPISALTQTDGWPRVAFAANLLHQLVLTLTKLSLCFFYLEVFPSKQGKRVVCALMAFIIAGFLSIELLTIFRCRPLTANWNKSTEKPGNCFSDTPLFIAFTVYNVVGDLALMSFVVPQFLRLQMPIRQKAVLVCISSLGFLVIAASIVRCKQIAHLRYSEDPTWDFPVSLQWSGIELSVGIICTSAIAIRPLVRRFVPWLLSSVPTSWATRHLDEPSRGPTKYASQTRGSKIRHEEDEIELRKHSYGNLSCLEASTTITIGSRGENDLPSLSGGTMLGKDKEGKYNGGKPSIFKTVNISVTEASSKSEDGSTKDHSPAKYHEHM